MYGLTKPAVQVFAPQDAAGKERQVINHDAQVWGTEVERSIEGAAEGRVIFSTWAELSATDGTRAGQPGRVAGPDAGTHTDPVVGGTVENVGDYVWSVTPEGWRRIGDLPNELIRAVNTHSGDPNVITANPSTPIPTKDWSALIALDIVADNTADAPTVQFAGDSTKYTITDAVGTPVSAGGLTAGMLINGYIVGTTFRVDMGPRGWSPLLRAVNDGERRVLELYDWVGGHGAKPTETGYLSSTGLVPDRASAVDVRGPAGPSGAGSGDMLQSVYDPQGISADAFDSANQTGRPTWRPKNVSVLLANNTLGYAAATPAETVSEGDILVTQEEGYAYRVAAAGASDEHVSTAGGVDLYVIPLYAENGIVTPEQFGASTEEADDTYAECQAAIDSGMPVRFRARRYTTSQPLDLNDGNVVDFGFATIFRTVNDAVSGRNANLRIEGKFGLRLSGGIFDAEKVTTSGIPMNTIYISDSEDIQWDGTLECRWSPSITMMTQRSKHLKFGTYICRQMDDFPDGTRDGWNINGCQFVSVERIIGFGDNGDDLVVLKTPFVGSEYETHTVNIGQIEAWGSYGAFSIGSQVFEDIYNVNIGSIVGHGTRRGVYLKIWNNTASFPSIPLSEYGEVYDVNIGTLEIVSTDPSRSLVPIYFDVNDDALLYKMHDIYIGSAILSGDFDNDFVLLDRVEKITFGRLTTRVGPTAVSSGTYSRRAFVLNNGARRLKCLGGSLESGSSEFVGWNVGNGTHMLRMVGVSFVSPSGHTHTDGILRPRTSDNIELIDCDFTEVSVGSAGYFPVQNLNTSARRTLRVENCAPLTTAKDSRPTSGVYIQGMRVPNADPSPGDYLGWVCTTTGDLTSSGVMKGYGAIEA